MSRITQFFIAAFIIIICSFQSCEKKLDSKEAADKISYRNICLLNEKSINGTAISASNDVAGIVVDAGSGKGIAGVNVTDGYQFVRSDANGVYQMKRSPKARKIYYTTPAGYKIVLDDDMHRPAFFNEGELSSTGRIRINFKLEKMEKPSDDFTLIMVGDPQCKDIKEVSRYEDECVTDIVRTAREKGSTSGDDVIAITLGDITFDSYDTWAPMAESMSNVAAGGAYLPFFQCIGNHDHNSLCDDTADDAKDDYNATGKFVETFGPTDYSFDRGKTHIIVLDDICVLSKSSSNKSNKATWKYVGGVTDEQYEWLKQDIANVEDREGKLCIICGHIPFRGGSKESGSNVSLSRHYQDVMQLLSSFGECHIMIGHTHYQQNYIHDKYVCKGGKNIYEHIHGGACGAWWSTDCNCTGAPNGYSVYSIKGANVAQWYLKGSNKPKDYQLRVFDGDMVFTGSCGFEYQWSQSSTYRGCEAKGFSGAKGAFVAEVFDDDKYNWKVEMYQGSVKVGDFLRGVDGGISNIPLVSLWFNEKGKSSTTYTSSTASHYWCFKPAGGVRPKDMKEWEVRATLTVPTNPNCKLTYTCNHFTTDYSEYQLSK